MNATIAPIRTKTSFIEFMNRSTAIIAIETSSLLLIALIAVGGNIMVVISYYRNPSLRTITNYFVLSLAITDIIAPITIMPLTLTWSAMSRFVFGQELCEFQAIMIMTLSTVSILNIVLMAVNRFIRVCKPAKYQKLFNKKTSLIMIGIVWVIPFTSLILLVKVVGIYYGAFMPHMIICYLVYTKGDITTVVVGNSFLMVTLVLPFSIISFCYFKVFKKIRDHKKNIAPSSNQSNLGTSVQDIKITWILFAVLVGYVFTWAPIVFIMALTNVNWDLPRQAKILVTYAAASSSAINPMIYGVLNTALRKEFVSILGCN